MLFLEKIGNDKENNQNISEEIDHFVSSVLEQIQHFKKKLDRNDRPVRFSPIIMRMMLSLWSKYNSVYWEFLESNLLTLSSESILKKKRQKLSVHKGYCSKHYFTFYGEFIKKN